MKTDILTRLPVTACEDDDHRFAGSCTEECARLVENMMSDGYYEEPMIYSDYLGGESSIDWSGCHRGPIKPEEAVEFDSVNRAVIMVMVHPNGCECPVPHDTICEWVEVVSDDAFGYWDHTWGHPPVHEFHCDKPATVVLEIDGYEGSEEIAFCAEHAQQEQ